MCQKIIVYENFNPDQDQTVNFRCFLYLTDELIYITPFCLILTYPLVINLKGQRHEMVG
jgi:hypothetical protein